MRANLTLSNEYESHSITLEDTTLLGLIYKAMNAKIFMGTPPTQWQFFDETTQRGGGSTAGLRESATKEWYITPHELVTTLKFIG